MDISEKEFLKKYDITKFPRPSVTADVVAIGIQDVPTGNYRKPFKSKVCVLLIKRGAHPYKGKWALPGGFLKEGETIEECAIRELEEETKLENQFLANIGVFSKPNRDPRGWIVSCAFMAIVKKVESAVVGGDDADEAKWFPIDKVLKEDFELSFDHKDIIEQALITLRKEDKYEVSFKFLSKKFTLSELQFVHEFIEGKKLLAPNFRRKSLPYIEEFEEENGLKEESDLGSFSLCACSEENGFSYMKKEKELGVGHRPATFFRKREFPLNRKIEEEED